LFDGFKMTNEGIGTGTYHLSYRNARPDLSTGRYSNYLKKAASTKSLAHPPYPVARMDVHVPARSCSH